PPLAASHRADGCGRRYHWLLRRVRRRSPRRSSRHRDPMSVDTPRKVTTRRLQEMKEKGEPIACLTAYDYLTATILDAAGIDLILVGDSAGNVFAGYDTTIPMTMEQMLYHAQVVARGVERAFVVADLPFMSYQVSEEEALRNAGRFVKEALAEAVKL